MCLSYKFLWRIFLFKLWWITLLLHLSFRHGGSAPYWSQLKPRPTSLHLSFLIYNICMLANSTYLIRILCRLNKVIHAELLCKVVYMRAVSIIVIFIRKRLSGEVKSVECRARPVEFTPCSTSSYLWKFGKLTTLVCFSFLNSIKFR
jgi:hypothetical protein